MGVTIVETTIIATPPTTITTIPQMITTNTLPTIMEVTTTQTDVAVLLFLSPTIMVTSTETVEATMLERDLGATLLGGTVAAQTFKVPQGSQIILGHIKHADIAESK